MDEGNEVGGRESRRVGEVKEIRRKPLVYPAEEDGMWSLFDVFIIP